MCNCNVETIITMNTIRRKYTNCEDSIASDMNVGISLEKLVSHKDETVLRNPDARARSVTLTRSVSMVNHQVTYF